jgi:hypothetical protein
VLFNNGSLEELFAQLDSALDATGVR